MKGSYNFLLLFISITLWNCDNGKTSAYISEEMLDNPQFIGNASCSECHDVAFANWKGSDHDKAMDHANAGSVLGDFNDVIFSSRDIESRFFKRDSNFYVYTNGPKGEMQEYKIEYTFGHYPLQQYLIEFDKGRLQCLPIAWDSRQNKWFSLVDSVYSDMEIPPNDWLYWTNNGQNWNAMCAECHSTNLQKGFDFKTNEYQTTWSEIDVNCEACHGPASNHLLWAKMEDESKLDIAYTGFPNKSIGLSNEETLNQCAFCHARRSSLGDNDHMSSHYLNQFLPQLVNEEHYYYDGQIRDEDYVFGSFTQSRMHTRLVGCIDCHEPHNLRTKQQGNLLCLQCHNHELYDTEKHHFHYKTGIGQSEELTSNGFYDRGDGTQCVDCHMTGEVYMGVDFRRDHNFRSPRPDISMRVGSPDACTSCHTDMSQKEAAEMIMKWYPESLANEGYGDLFFKIAQEDASAITSLIPYLSDTSKSSMVRASAIEYISRLNSLEGVEAIEDQLSNEDPLVRYAATSFYWDIERAYELNAFEKALKDSLKAIRIIAFTRLLSLNYQTDDSVKLAQFNLVSEEHLEYLKSSADFAVSRHNLGVYYANLGDNKNAILQLKEAIKIDDQYYPAMLELAILYSKEGRNDLAEKWLLYTLANNQNERRAIQYLALLKAELKEYGEALRYFERLSALEPQNARNFYNMAFVQIELKDDSGAEKSYLKALSLEPTNIDYLYAIGYFYVQSNQKEKAQSVSQRMLEIYPNEAFTRQLLSFLASS
jgi:tetratricopeptide (TPR) repeat protein